MTAPSLREDALEAAAKLALEAIEELRYSQTDKADLLSAVAMRALRKSISMRPDAQRMERDGDYQSSGHHPANIELFAIKKDAK